MAIIKAFKGLRPPKDIVKRSRLYAVRDCGLLSCPVTPNLMRGRMLALPLKPLLHIAFVSVSVVFLILFNS